MFCKLNFHVSSVCKIRQFNGFYNVLIYNSYSKQIKSSNLLSIVSDMLKSNRRTQRVNKSQPHFKDEPKISAGRAYLQVLGSGTVGAPKSLYLFTDCSRYLFNCGEGSQRLAHEHKIKLSKLGHIFVTNSTWDSIGGLPGLSLTLQDCGVTNIELHGPPGLNELYEATKKFVIMKNLNVQMAKCQPELLFEDGVISVSYVPLMKKGAGTYKAFLEAVQNECDSKENMSRRSKAPVAIECDNTDYYAYEGNNRQENSDNNSGSKRSRSLPKTIKWDSDDNDDEEAVFRQPKRSQVCSMAYICQLTPRLGTLDLEKCVEFGVKPGPLLGLLKNGQDVVLENNRTVRADEVKTPDEPGPIFIVLDVPDSSYLDSLLSEKLFDKFRVSKNPTQKNKDELLILIVHFSPACIINDKRYQMFINDFSAETKHMFVNDSNACFGSIGIHQVQHKLHILDEAIFPMFGEFNTHLANLDNISSITTNKKQVNNNLEIQESAEFCNQDEAAHFRRTLTMEDNDLKTANNSNNNIEGRTLTMFQLRPMDGYDNSQEPKLNINEYIAEVMDTPGFTESLNDYKAKVDKLKCDTYPKVVFLGTGSCIPSKTRNTSGILIHISENSVILLDCGEGTYGQIVRFYGPNLANKILLSLKAVYVSHLHADHHLGLIGVLKGRRKAFSSLNPESTSDLPTLRKVYLLAPNQILPWLNFYDRRFENISDDYEIIPNNSVLYRESDKHANHLPPYVQKQLEVANIQTCQVRHCPNAFGVAVTVDDKKITYSGDTIPCDDLIKLGFDSTLLIHEATMEDELSEEARAKMHSTTSQAIEVGNKMNAKHVILTHFSQRYARMPRLKNLKPGIDMSNVGIAFDNMQISLDQLSVLPHMYKPLELIFAEHCQEMDMRAMRRAKKRIRNQSPIVDRIKSIIDANKTRDIVKFDDNDQSRIVDTKKQKESS